MPFFIFYAMRTKLCFVDLIVMKAVIQCMAEICLF